MSKCGSVETAESLHTKLTTGRQGRQPQSSFVEDLDLLAAKITNLEIKEQNLTDPAAQAAIRSTIKRQALMAFKKGVHDEYKAVIEAARPATLEEALAITTSAGVNQAYPPQINTYRPSYRPRGQYYPRPLQRVPGVWSREGVVFSW